MGSPEFLFIDEGLTGLPASLALKIIDGLRSLSVGFAMITHSEDLARGVKVVFDFEKIGSALEVD